MISLEQYYSDEENLNKILDSLESPGLRVWKVQYTDNSFRQNSKKINNTKKLKELLLPKNKLPSKVYVSVSKFLNPQRVYGKHPKGPCYKIADALFLKSDLLFDLDSEGELSIAHEDGKKIIKFMEKKRDYVLINIRFSGNKGFHLLYRDNNLVQEPHPIERIRKTEARRKRLVKKLPELKTIDELHKNIICDQFRVHAVLNTIKAKTGNLVKEISLKDFMSLSTLALQAKYVETPVSSVKRTMITDESILTSIPGNERPGVISTPPYYYHFVDNRVKGVKDNYITVLKYPKDKRVKHIIKKLQQEYKLSCFYKFEYKTIQMWINFKLLDIHRLNKIMRYAKPMNLNSFMFYKHTWIPISEAVDNDGNIMWERPLLTEFIESNYGNNDVHSRPHANLMNLKFDKMAGKQMNRVCKAKVENK